MSSPIACSTAADARRRWCWAPPPSARWSRGCCAAPISSSGRGFRRSFIPATRRSPGCRARSAIVAFSADEVYAIAELIRRQRGGAAVVMGSLSPRTRNAQVELYQSGDVDYLVATDAIGMGLNLDVDHVAFASERKFDGYQFRHLNPSNWRRLPAAPAARSATVRSAQLGAVRLLTKKPCTRSKATRLSRSKCCNGATPIWNFHRSARCRHRWR